MPSAASLDGTEHEREPSDLRYSDFAVRLWREAFDSLSLRKQDVLWRGRVLCEPYKEIAEDMGMSEGAARMMAHRAFEKITAQIAERAIDSYAALPWPAQGSRSVDVTLAQVRHFGRNEAIFWSLIEAIR